MGFFFLDLLLYHISYIFVGLKIYFINIVPYFPVYFTKQEWISWKMENLKMVRFPFWTRQREGVFRIILCRSDIKTLTLCGDKNKNNFSWSQQVMLNQFRFVCCHPVTIFRILNSRIRNTIFLVFFSVYCIFLYVKYQHYD